MSEALQGFLADLSYIKTLPDADLEFIISLETQILQKLRAPFEQMAGQMDEMGAAAGAGPGMPPGMSGGAPSGGAMPVEMQPPGGGVPGIRSSPGMPDPDELRRLIGANTQ